jgi:hypothetical protein
LQDFGAYLSEEFEALEVEVLLGFGLSGVGLSPCEGGLERGSRHDGAAQFKLRFGVL